MMKVNNLRQILVAWMASENLLAQVCTIYVSIDFCCREVFVTQHLLNSLEVRSTLEQVSGKTMSERVWRDVLCDASLSSILPNIDKETDARQGTSAAQGDKDMVGKTSLWSDVTTYARPALELADGTRRDRYKSFLATLASDTYEAIVEEEVSKGERDKLADTQTARV